MRRPGAAYEALAARRQVPIGSSVDATRGRVRLTAAVAGAATSSAEFSAGAFRVAQSALNPLTQVTLAGAPSCRARRRLVGDGGPGFRTRGRRATATSRGARWLTEDSCAGTRVTVSRGAVTVRDLGRGRGRDVSLRAGRGYLSRAHRRPLPSGAARG